MPKETKPNRPLKYRNISVDADIVDVLRRKGVELESTLGFKPTISQTLRYMLKNN